MTKKTLPADTLLRLSQVLAAEAGRQAADKVFGTIEYKIKAEDTRKRILPMLSGLVDVLNENLDPKRLDPSQKFYLLSDTQPDEALKNGQHTLGFALVYSAPHELQGFEWKWDQDSSGNTVSDLNIRFYRFANQAAYSPVWVEHNGGYVTHTPFETDLARYGHAKFTVPVNNDQSKSLEITAILPLKDPTTGRAYVATHSNLDIFLNNIIKAFDLNKLTVGKIAAGYDLGRYLELEAIRRVMSTPKPNQP